jgi:DNA-directed RNA polymerase subunit RPC12/RpoP
MQGRNGQDALGKASLIASLILLVISSFSRSGILYLVAIAVLGYAYFRIMSKNIQKRYYENQKYLDFIEKIKRFFGGDRSTVDMRTGGGYGQRASKRENGGSFWKREKTEPGYRIYKCPSCGQKTRVPKHKGRIEITCPKCRNKFIKRT